MNYNNITFDGRHCREHMGLIYVPDKPEKIIAPQEVYSYRVGGVPGTVAYGDKQDAEPYTLTGTFYPAMDVGDEAAVRRLWRAIAQWLGVGRRQLIMDSEPDKYIIAEVQQMDCDEYGWVEDGLKVTWLCQPFHWAVKPRELELSINGTKVEAATVTDRWTVETSLPTAVSARFTNNAAVAITSAFINVAGKQVSFSGMQLLPGECLEVVMTPPIGAVIIAADGSQRSAMEYMTAFEMLEIKDSAWISGSVIYASSSARGEVSLRLSARPCWR